eukprot:1139570-Pyramimonas_sp.AAC.1
MSVPTPIICFFAALYTDSAAIVTLSGRRLQRIKIERGVRQGDPTSMCLFALALDPILRWLL